MQTALSISAFECVKGAKVMDFHFKYMHDLCINIFPNQWYFYKAASSK